MTMKKINKEMSCMYAINAPPRPKPNYFTYCNKYFDKLHENQ